MTDKPNPRSPAVRPWHPAPYSVDVVYALQNLSKGTATEGQQKAALDWIVRSACGTYDATFVPDSDRETVFAEAKRHVGLQLVKLVTLPRAVIEAMRTNERKPRRKREDSING